MSLPNLISHRARAASLHLPDLIGGVSAPSLRFEAAGVHFDFSKQRVDAAGLAALDDWADAAGVAETLRAVARGDAVNTTERRAAGHMWLRAPSIAAPGDATWVAEFDRQKRLAEQLHTGQWLGATGKPITRLINIGIGGSDLGVRLVNDALASGMPVKLEIRYVTNTDAAELTQAVAGASVETTALVIASKTFTTQETLHNAHAAITWLRSGLGERTLQPHLFAATAAPERAMELGVPEAQVLRFAPWVGGRFSVWSSVGWPLRAAYGNAPMDAFLAGAAAMDQHALTAAALQNAPVLAALLRAWQREVFAMPHHAVVPYAYGLRRLPDYLQQLIMESLGKGVSREMNAVEGDPCSAVWGAVGTAGQHAFFQWLHQHPRGAAVEFVAVKPDADIGSRLRFENAVAQARALAFARLLPSNDPLGAHKVTPGNRPSNFIVLPRLDARSLGALIAFYEHSVVAEAALYKLNPFDQFGVEYGKHIAHALAAGQGERDASTAHLLSLANL